MDSSPSLGSICEILAQRLVDDLPSFSLASLTPLISSFLSKLPLALLATSSLSSPLLSGSKVSFYESHFYPRVHPSLLPSFNELPSSLSLSVSLCLPLSLSLPLFFSLPPPLIRLPLLSHFLRSFCRPTPSLYVSIALSITAHNIV